MAFLPPVHYSGIPDSVQNRVKKATILARVSKVKCLKSYKSVPTPSEMGVLEASR